jgi:predicted DNA-binding protein (MmcQ/YjbR family)
VLTAEELRGRCLELTGTNEEFPFRPGLSVFKVSGKVFALVALEERPLRISLKCEPGLAEQLRDTYAAIRPGYHLNKRHWNTVQVDGSLPDRLVLDMIEDSYDLVVEKLPKKTQAVLGWPPANRDTIDATASGDSSWG